jgi:predicted Zn-dependent protease
MFMNLGNVESNAGKRDRAVALYQEALRRAPEQPIIWLGFAQVLAKEGDSLKAGEALAHAEHSPLLRAECMVLRAFLDGIGETLHGIPSRSNYTESIRAAVALEPANWSLRKRYVEHLAGMSPQREAALRELRSFLAKQSFRAESWQMLGKLLEDAGNLPAAASSYDQAALRDVRDSESVRRAARLRADDYRRYE